LDDFVFQGDNRELPEQLDSDMVEERGELLLLPLPCSLPYARQRL